jgi:hypothetical protein
MIVFQCSRHALEIILVSSLLSELLSVKTFPHKTDEGEEPQTHTFASARRMLQ